MLKYLPLSLIIACVFFASCGQNKAKGPYVWSETKDSLYFNNMVRNIKQDKSGNILIAYNKGVVRYDARLPYGQGKSFTDLTSRVGSPMFWDVQEDRKGNIWLATRDSGVYYYPSTSLMAGEKPLPLGQSGQPAAKAGFKHFTTKDGLANNRVTAIYEDKAGIIWFGTERGLSRYDPSIELRTGPSATLRGSGESFRNFTTKDGLPNNSIATMTEDKTGKLWIGTAGELCFYDGKTFTIFRNKDGKTFTGVKSIINDRKGNILFGAYLLSAKKRISPGGVIMYGEDGLWRYGPSTSLRTGPSTMLQAGGGIITKVSQRNPTALMEDRKGNIWTTGGIEPYEGNWALSRFDQITLYSKKPVATEIIWGAPRNLNSNIRGLLEAKDGSIWFGGPKGGLYRYDGKAIAVF